MRIQKGHKLHANLPTIIQRSWDNRNYQSCIASSGGATPREKTNGNEKFLIKNLSKVPIEYEQQSNITISTLIGRKRETGSITKYKPHLRERESSNISIRLSRSEQLLSKAKEINNRHFNFKLRGLKSQSNLQPSKSYKIQPLKQNVNLMQTTLPNFHLPSQQRIQELRKYKKRNFARCKWLLD